MTCTLNQFNARAQVIEFNHTPTFNVPTFYVASQS